MSYWFAFVLTLLAGLSTGIGSILVFFTKKDNSKFLSISLGFSAGVMIYVSMVEILQEAKITLIQALGDVNGSWLAVSAFFAGVIFIAVIDRLVPSEDNPHEVCSTTELRGIHS
ncbi:MAG: zinc transporter ZupT, partial [Peptococcaceae bacterium]|nr:zinc transporter ZupT [Peptococcaceae bacterium]